MYSKYVHEIKIKFYTDKEKDGVYILKDIEDFLGDNDCNVGEIDIELDTSESTFCGKGNELLGKMGMSVKPIRNNRDLT